ncbi:hypothetical protein KAI46_13860, partial [bacterium]|nr:hypothetical protein [bacterium]
MGRTHIIGCGKFGQRALEFYSSGSQSQSLVLVDSEKRNLIAGQALLAGSGVKTLTSSQDAVDYLGGLLEDDENCKDDWIIPTVPLHLAFAMLEKAT